MAELVIRFVDAASTSSPPDEMRGVLLGYCFDPSNEYAEDDLLKLKPGYIDNGYEYPELFTVYCPLVNPSRAEYDTE